ncbi:MAG: tRNA (N6-threonylcarbamoyladenosine(37)-N6)-methyltransferase TrmO [Thermoplasmata archaeon]|nr:tRNA (N6-threonylcarbamoyladenosine(37)-N6)-methyltransferase TrmO [Thermoplasmata archaeon]
MDPITFTPIGIVHSPFGEPTGTPIQPRVSEGAIGTVEIFPEYAPGLRDLEGFSHIVLIYQFHLSRSARLEVVPYLDDRPHGVFATRSPSRPNPIGLSIVRLLGVEGNQVRVQDLDIVDGTPLLDIKPYVPEFDPREAVRVGWLEGKIGKLEGARDDGRFEGRTDR